MRRFEVLLHQHVVGHLTEHDDRRVVFAFNNTYKRLPQRPVLSQKFEDSLDRKYQAKQAGELPAFFANLVPEGQLRDIIDRELGLPEGDDLAFLAAVSQDLPGAVMLREVTSSGELDLPLDGSSEEATPAPVTSSDRGMRFSLAGVQLKFSMLRQADKLVIPARGQHGEWIVKCDSERWIGLPENEFTMLEWARAADFEVPACHLHDINDVFDIPEEHRLPGTKVLAIERYDRQGARRLHQEDFAQVVGYPPKLKYDHITYEKLTNVVQSVVGEAAYAEVVRRLIFMVACGNSDAHLKNWSLLYPDGINPRLAPLYDQVATVAWPGIDREVALKLAGVKKFSDIDRAAFERLAERVHRSRADVDILIEETLARLAEAWRSLRESDIPMRNDHVEALYRHWQRVPLLRDSVLVRGDHLDRRMS